MKLESSAFSEGETIPTKYTCEGSNISPPLRITDAPENTQSFVLVMDDPDATRGVTWDHWIVWNIPPETVEIEEGALLPNVCQGITSFGDARYGGPCPPKGAPAHRYMSTLYALDTLLDLPENSNRAVIEGAMEGHIIDRSVLMGYFGRNT